MNQWKSGSLLFVLPSLYPNQPLNMVWLWMLVCDQAKLFDQIRFHQVVGTPAVGDDTCMPVIDDEEGVKQVVALLLVRLLHLCAKNSLDNNAPIGGCLRRTKHLAVVIIVVVIGVGIIFYIRSAHVASIRRRYVCLLVGTIALHMSPHLALVTMKCTATHGSS